MYRKDIRCENSPGKTWHISPGRKCMKSMYLSPGMYHQLKKSGSTFQILTSVTYITSATFMGRSIPLQWRQNERDGVSDHQPHDSLLNRLFRRRSKKTSMLRVSGLCAWNSPETGEFPRHKWPVTWKMLPFDDVIMGSTFQILTSVTYNLRNTNEYIWHNRWHYMDDLVQECSNSSVLATKSMQSCTMSLSHVHGEVCCTISVRNILADDVPWASYQIRKIACCSCTENAWNVFPATAG